MSYFRVALQRQSERQGLSQTDVANRAGLSRSYVSRLLSGDHADLSDQNFLALLKAFDRHGQAELTSARCQDARVSRAAIRRTNLIARLPSFRRRGRRAGRAVYPPARPAPRRG